MGAFLDLKGFPKVSGIPSFSAAPIKIQRSGKNKKARLIVISLSLSSFLVYCGEFLNCVLSHKIINPAVIRFYEAPVLIRLIANTLFVKPSHTTYSINEHEH